MDHVWLYSPCERQVELRETLKALERAGVTASNALFVRMLQGLVEEEAS